MQKLILLVDDDQEEVLILDQAIQMAGLSCQSVWASDAKRAEQLLQQMLPDLILIDYNMPITNGITCLQNIRKMDGLQQVQIIMYSTHISNMTREQAMMEGATCMQKTATIPELVTYLLNLSGEGKALPSLVQYNQ